jgi:hypothetical protein
MIDATTPGVPGSEAGAPSPADPHRRGTAAAEPLGQPQVPAVSVRCAAARLDLGAPHAQTLEARVPLLLKKILVFSLRGMSMNPTVYLPAGPRMRRRRAADPAVVRACAIAPAAATHKHRADAVGRTALAFLLGAGFALGTALPMKTKASPYNGTAISVPATIPAVNYNKGGQGVGYHDKTSGNAGGQYRPADDVDIVQDATGPVVNNFQTGEWLAYTIKVPTTGKYNIHIYAASAFTSSSFHAQIDGVNVTGNVAVPTTGGWSTYKWVGKSNVPLEAGVHVLKVFADQQFFNLKQVRVTGPVPAAQTEPVAPYTGTPLAVPGSFPAHYYDKGGQGRSYYDKSTGNAGGEYRPADNVDIVQVNDASTINNIQTGEWLKYTVNIAETAQYDIALRVSSAMSTGAFHVQLDGTNVTGSVAVPNTGTWGTFRWATKSGVTLPAGQHVIKVVADKQYFNLRSIKVTKTGTNPDPGGGGGGNPPPSGGNQQFFCTFQNSPGECGFGIQAASNNRVAIVAGGRDGGTAVRLRTEPGDSNIFGSGDSERADLSLSQGQTDCSQGKEAWWAHSVLFPTDYVPALDGFGVVMDFHHDYPTGQANFHLDSSRWDGKLHFRGYGGPNVDGGEYETTIGPIVKNQWYDFVYHVRWSSGGDGFMRAWVNGVKKLDHQGPTLYSGIDCYLKLANYHTPFGQSSSVIHDRVIRGTTWDAVSLTPLEGVQ